jgi:hypothetical protein
MAAMSNDTRFPLEVQGLVAQYQDRLYKFNQGDPADPRWDTLHHGEMAYNLFGDLIDRLVVLRAELGRKVEEYRAAVKGAGR